MRASYKWLKELCLFDLAPEQVAERLTSAGLEVEGQKRYGDLPGVVVAEVRSKRPHPSRDKLNLVTVFDGARESEVVCGAPNVPAPGKRVLFAQSGARLPNGMVISERNLGGVVSNGMICSELELDIGAEDDGIVVLADELLAQPGTPVADALGLADVVFEIGLTPNRPDCLGHVGLARELSAVLNAPLRLPALKVPQALRAAKPAASEGRPVVLFGAQPSGGGQPVAFADLSVLDTQRCPRYATAVVEGVTVGVSPFWLRYRLHVLGLRAINSVVDITNLVLLEYGYPTHAFDFEHVRGERIVVRTAREGEQIETLDGVKRALVADDLLICDAERALAVAGVMGGQESGVQPDTKRVLIECAYFDPRTVRRTSRRLGLHTDASHRFERGVDPRAVPGVLARVVSLICELAGGATSAHGFEIYPEAIKPREIRLRLERVERLLGGSPPEGRAQAILAALGCELDSAAGASLLVRAPTWRPDLTREEDLIEEIARIWGYGEIPTEVPRVRASLSGADLLSSFVRRLKSRAASVGLTEAVNLAFNSSKQLEQARAPLPAVRVANPLSEERSLLRTSLLPGLLANVQRAQRHQVSRVSLFELARVFRPTSDLLPEERYKLAFVLFGERANWLGDGSYDFYDAKGLLEAICSPLLRQPLETKIDDGLAAQQPALHPRRSARVLVADRAVGALGELHPDVVDALGLTGPVVCAELDVSDLLATAAEGLAPELRAVPRFPASRRDLAVAVDEQSEAGTVAQALREAGGSLIEAVELFDLYRGGQLPPGKKSLAFRITYRDPEGTLTDQRVEEAHGRVVNAAERLFSAALRG